MRKRVFWGVLLAGVSLAAPIVAGDLFSTRSQTNLFASQLRVLDIRAASQYVGSVRLKPPSIHTPGEWVALAYTGEYRGKYRGKYLDMARAAARRHNVPEELFLRLIQQESAWNSQAKSHKGALGLAQLMPGTARDLQVDPLDPFENLDGGARYLRQQYERFRSWRLALAAYNAGPQAVKRHGGVPPYRETRNYVRIILGS